jgi:hypothetical protein
MKHMNTVLHQKSIAFFAVLSWTTLVAQFVLLIQNRATSVIEAMLRYFTFFTILTNILVAVVFTVVAFQWKHKGSFFTKSKTQTATAVYIFVVGFVYNVILRFLWQPQGVQRVVDELLHLIIPIIYIVYWYFNVRTSGISYKSIWNWLMYPMVYLVVVMIRGYFSEYYPYPFINVVALGYEKALINSAGLTVFFGLVSIVFVWIARFKSRD